MNRALSALGLARRAGKLNWGFDTAVEAMRSSACGVVILAADLSDKTKKNVRFEAEKYNVSVLEPAFTMEEISAAIGNKGQNARLAAKLTGWKIDIKPESGFFGEEEEA